MAAFMPSILYIYVMHMALWGGGGGGQDLHCLLDYSLLAGQEVGAFL